jgi:hypothetical protein
MMRLRRISLLVALSLLTSAATAYAECAWVLWQQQAEISPGGSVSSSDWTWLTAEATSLAPHQPRPARDAAHTLERGGVGFRSGSSSSERAGRGGIRSDAGPLLTRRTHRPRD